MKAAIRGLNFEGAPGPDGIPVFFYLECWDVVGDGVDRGVQGWSL